MNEHKAVKTIAAEVLGRLPPSYTARAAQDIFKYVETPSAETADAARAALYAVCHAATVHGASATLAATPPVLEPLSQYCTTCRTIRMENGQPRRSAAPPTRWPCSWERRARIVRRKRRQGTAIGRGGLRYRGSRLRCRRLRLGAAVRRRRHGLCGGSLVGAFSLSNGLADAVITARQRRDGCGVFQGFCGTSCSRRDGCAAADGRQSVLLALDYAALAGACIHGGAPRAACGLDAGAGHSTPS